MITYVAIAIILEILRTELVSSFENVKLSRAHNARAVTFGARKFQGWRVLFTAVGNPTTIVNSMGEFRRLNNWGGAKKALQDKYLQAALRTHVGHTPAYPLARNALLGR